MLRFILHYGFHFIVPIAVGLFFYRKNTVLVVTILLSAIIIDMDHLWADPVFDPNRCSINFHPLHSYLAIGVYFVLFLLRKTRIIGLALLLHILADTIDCYLMS
ncbi:DUF6122 family protein [Eudoraea chungangensis]|uniref:DUF6122 family protein n=1 Tax=Eudoraea chungangensis TaxID=1481905 RepID=UPI0023ED6FC3|nr:DUF6122 family protein [Eudoraea chungangensis]